MTNITKLNASVKFGFFVIALTANIAYIKHIPTRHAKEGK